MDGSSLNYDPKTQETRTTCPYCGVGCGIVVSESPLTPQTLSGDDRHPANFGRLCSKGTALLDTLRPKGRLQTAQIKTVSGFESVSSERAASEVARRFAQTIEKHGPDSVAFYVSGQLLSEDYYAINKLAKGFIGTANIDTNSRLCMASAVSAHKSAFGADLVPGTYEDIIASDLLIFSGHNAAFTHPVLYRQIEQRTDQFRIVIDPKRTETAKLANLHLMIRPQSDVRLWNGLNAYLVREGLLDFDFIARHTEGFDDYVQSLKHQDQSLEEVARDCDLDVGHVLEFYQRFAQTPKTVSLFSMGSNQSTQGVSKGLSLIYAHLLTGKIGKLGAAPFSFTGQPNAMGGREIGGLANMLAAHMDFTPADIDRVGRFWHAPNMAQSQGLKAVEMFKAVHEGKIKAIWIMATNPAVSMPDAHFVREALSRCETVVVSDVVGETDTSAFAHITLPAQAWGEKDGTVTNSERVISRQRAFKPAASPDVLADWQWIAKVAQQINPDWQSAFSWKNSHEVFLEYAKLSAFENDGSRFYNLSGLTELSKEEYQALTPIRWPVTKNKDGAPEGASRLFTDGRFATPSKKARFSALEAKAALSDPDFPLSLNSARIRDQWHTMTRTAVCDALTSHVPEPLVLIHPKTARDYGIIDERLAKLNTRYGEAVFKAKLSEDVRPDALWVPMHFSAQFCSDGLSNGLISPRYDAVSGQPEFKHTPVKIEPYGEKWHGFLVIADEDLSRVSAMLEGIVWRRMPKSDYHLFEIAHKSDFLPLLSQLDVAFGVADLVYEDVKSGLLRRAWLKGEQLKCALFLAPITADLPTRAWVCSLFERPLDEGERHYLLLGAMPGIKDKGPIICACHGVRQADIIDGITGGARTIEAIGASCKAGTQCGSCKPEIGRLLGAHKITVIPA